MKELRNTHSWLIWPIGEKLELGEAIAALGRYAWSMESQKYEIELHRFKILQLRLYVRYLLSAMTILS